jgi:AraC-like DNA-binding protein
MIYKEILPSLALQGLIKSFLLVNWQVEQGLPFLVKPYPTRIEQSLVFFARGFIHSEDLQSGTIQKINQTAIFGQQVNRLNFHSTPNPDFLMLMVNFQSGGLNRFLGLSAQELTNCFIDSESVINSEVRQVNERLANSKSYEEMIEIIEHYLIQKSKKIKIEINLLDKIGDILLNHPMKFSLDWLADQACLSPRQFERKFTERMGISPKLYSRINRFYQAFICKENNPHLDWLSVALQFGYNDYQHLVKDCRQFAQVTPTILLNQYNQRVEKLLNLV